MEAENTSNIKASSAFSMSEEIDTPFQKLKPAKEVAGEFGYTSDYISKLAREGKIVGQKIKGSWYVEEGSVASFFDQVEKEKEVRKSELSEKRHEEYLTSLKANSQKIPQQTRVFTFTLARTFAAAAGLFVFIFSFAFGHTLVNVGPIAAGTVVKDVYLDTGTFLYSQSSRIFANYLSFVEHRSRDVLNVVHAIPELRTLSYDDFTEQLAALWSDRSLIMDELEHDRNAMQDNVFSAYRSVGVSFATSINQSLGWYKEQGIVGASSAIASSADWFRTTATNYVVAVRNTAATSASRAAVAAVSLSGETSLAFSWNPLSWFESVHTFFSGSSDAPPTVIIREEPQVAQTPPTIVGPTTILRNVTEAVTISGVSSSELASRLQILENALRSEIYETAARADKGVTGNYRAIQLSNVINTLDNVTLNNPTIIGGSVSGTSGVGGGGASNLSGLSDVASLSPSYGNVLYYDGSEWTTIATSSLGISGGSSFGQAFELTTNTFSQSALAPTTTQNLAISGTGTSTFAGGLEAWRQIAAPYFHATSSTATSTFAGGLTISGNLNLFGAYGNSWDDFCTAITGGSGLCDGVDNTASGGSGLATSTDIADTYVIYGTSVADVGAEAAFTYDDATNLLTVENASTTRVSSSYASSTSAFFGSLTVGSLSGFLKATAGAISTALIDLTTDVTGILGVSNGGTGWGNIQANTLVLGNGTSGLATTSAGTNGQILALVGGVPSWVATTTFSSGLTYSGGNVTADLGTSISAAEIADGDHGDFTYSSGSATIDADAVALGTDTTGNYVATLTSSGSITVGNSGSESAAATVNLNLANANAWTALQTFLNASSTLFSAYTAYFGATATTSIDTAGNVTFGGNIVIGGDTINEFAGTGLTVSGNALTATLGTSVDLASEVTGTLPVANGGTGATSFTSSQLLYGAGTGALQSVATTSVSCTGSVSCTSFDVLGSSPITITGSGGSSFGQAFELTTNTFSQSALAPTTTQNLAITGTGTSTFAGGLEAWRQIAAPYFHATSSTATSTFAGGLTISGNLNLFGAYGNSWDDFCTAITGGSGLCDGVDSTGGGTGLATSTDIVDTYIIYGTSASDVGAEAAFTYDDATDRLTVVNASTTALSAFSAAFGATATTSIDTAGNVTFGGNIVIGGDTINEFAGTGLTVSGNALTATLGTSISAAEIADGDHGDFSYASGLATLDVNTVSDNEIDYTTVTLADFTNDANFITLSSLSATWPLAYNSGTGAFTWGGIATSSNIASGQVLYATGANTFESVATSSITYNSTLTTSGTPGYVIGGSGFTLGVATTTNSLFTGTAGQVLAYTASGWTGVATTTFSSGLTYSGGNVTADLGTSVDLTTEVTGTLPVANGGTGATTFTNNRLLTGNGTSALVDEANLTFDGSLLTVTGNASTTQIGSTGAAFFATSGGSVGIGTTSPGTKLEISTGSNTSGLRLLGAAYDEIADFYIGSSGNLVIDTTSGADTAGFIDLRPEDNSFGLVLRESDGTGTTPYANFYVTDNGASDYLNIRVSAATNASAGFFVNQNDAVGIGTSTPQWPLTSYSASGSQLALSAGAGVAQWAFRNSGGTFYLATTTVAGTATSSVAALTISTGGTLTTVGDVSVGGGTGKITVGTIDPVYTIDGVSYATYVSGMIGQKEEVVGSAVIDTETTDSEGNVGFIRVIDFDNEEAGSDLWLFSRATQLNKNIDKLVALLTPEGNAKVWYQINRAENQIILLSNVPTKVSYRFTAPRFDYEQWTNYNHDGITGFEPPHFDEAFFNEVAPEFSFAGSSLFDSLKEKIVAWFANIGNGIGEVFAQVFNASEKICVDGECLTRDDIRSLKQLASTGVLGATSIENEVNESGAAPTITILGNNPATIAVGSTYADLGATFTDDQDTNLGIHTFVNGVEVSTVTLDTATSTTYEITYRVTDTDGNVGEATRTVIVGEEVGEEATFANNQQVEEASENTNESPESTPEEAVQEELQVEENPEVVENNQENNESHLPEPEQ